MLNLQVEVTSEWDENSVLRQRQNVVAFSLQLL